MLTVAEVKAHLTEKGYNPTEEEAKAWMDGLESVDFPTFMEKMESDKPTEAEIKYLENSFFFFFVIQI